MQIPQILFVTIRSDDYRELLKLLESLNTQIIITDNSERAKVIVERRRVDAVVTDYQQPEEQVLNWISHIRKSFPQMLNIVLFTQEHARAILAAFRAGATDVLLPPISRELLQQRLLGPLLDSWKSERQDSVIAKSIPRDEGQYIVAESAAMKRIMDILPKIAAANSHVLIEGESGTGKELIARAIHGLSNRRIFPFIAVNAATLPEGLLESELFGHVKGSFTSAISSRKGLFEHAHHGVLFLDEIADVPLSVQAKLLRVIQDGAVRRVGSNDYVWVDVRLITATNRGLGDLVEKKLFRQDLYYRLNVFSVCLPPLRQRAADILPLAEKALDSFARKAGKGPMVLAAETQELFLKYDWPGNVRELENVIERAVALAQSKVIQVDDLSNLVHGNVNRPSGNPTDSATLAAVEQRHILSILEQAEGNRASAAEILGISRTTLWRKLREYGMTQPDE